LTINSKNSLDVSHLSGLTAAVYILKCFSEGKSRDQIVNNNFKGNRHLASIWINFLKANHWLEQNTAVANSKISVSEEGKKWLRRYEFALRNKEMQLNMKRK